MRYAQIRSMDISDGPFIRVGLYTQGCPLRCEGCHNKEQQSYDGGKEYTEETKSRILRLCEPDYVKGLSILGGEPFIDRNLGDLAALIDEFKERFPDKTVWIWSGYTYEQLESTGEPGGEKRKLIDRILGAADVLVDGPFVLAKRDISDNNKYKGSTNQRVIDLKATRKNREITEYQER